LGEGNIIGDAMMVNYAFLAIINDITGTGVTIAGLSYPAGVDNETLIPQRKGRGKPLKHPLSLLSEERDVGMTY
jgi:hypothetical protein